MGGAGAQAGAEGGVMPGRLRNWSAAGAGDTPHASFAISRSLNFWIFPVDVFGSSVNTT